MLISKAYAQEVAIDTAGAAAQVAAEAPSAANAFAWNMGLIAILVIMFYILLIRPQQKRFAEHKDMLGGLKKGDKVVTAGGLVGKVDKLAGDNEVLVDLGNGVKVTALLNTIQNKVDKTPAKAAQDKAPAKETKSKATKKTTAKTAAKTSAKK